MARPYQANESGLPEAVSFCKNSRRLLVAGMMRADSTRARWGIIGAMAACGTCGAEGLAPGMPCRQCGAMPAPDLDLDARPRAPARATKPKREVVEDAPLELAIDPRSLVQKRAAEQ